MTALTDLKKRFNRIVDPILNFFVLFGITPNAVTTSALFFLIFTVYFIVKKNMLASAFMIFFTTIVDALDGSLAKKVGSTKFGDFYDAFIDRVVEATIYIAIAYSFPELYLVCFLAFAFSFLTSYIAARAEVWTIGIKIKYVGGIGSRAGRITILIIAFLLDKLYIGLILIIVASFITMITRTIITFNTLIKR